MNAMPLLADWAIRSSILIATGAALLWIARVKDSAIRLAAWTAILIGSLMIPVLSTTLPKISVPVTRAVPQMAMPMAVIDTPMTESTGAPPVHTTAATQPGAPFDWTPAMLAIYGVTAFCLLVRLCAGLFGGLRLLRRSRAISAYEMCESDLVSAPVTLGVLKPVIVLPADWREWDTAKLNAVLAHERSHIERRDPVIQMISATHRALLWFSPLSWFLHSRIVRLAEEASDDAAITIATDRVFYAELLLEFMKHPALKGSAAGVPMARYGRPHDRVDRILDATSFSRGVTRWSVAAILILGTPLTYLAASAQTGNVIHHAIELPPSPQSPQVVAQATPPSKPTPAVAPKPKFDVTSVKPCNPDSPGAGGRSGGKGGGATTGRVHLNCTTLMPLIRNAYVRFADGINHSPELTILTVIEGGPSWLNSDQYTIEAEAEGSVRPAITFGPMMQSLLENRFQLKVHRETREGPIYALTLAKGGSKLQPAKQGPCAASDFNDAPPPFGPPPPEMANMQCRFFWITKKGPNVIIAGRSVTMEGLTSDLTGATGRLVTDRTGVTEPFDFRLTYAPDDTTPGDNLVPAPDDASAANEFAAAPLMTALQDQLGLKLEAAKGTRNYLVIDSISRPSPN